MPLPFILPSDQPFELYKGGLFEKAMRYLNLENSVYTEVDITGWEFRAAFRKNYKAADAALEIDTAGGGFVVTDGPNGDFKMVITDLETANFDFNMAQPEGEPYTIPYHDYVFDIEAIPPGGDPVVFLKGVLRVYAEVTR